MKGQLHEVVRHGLEDAGRERLRDAIRSALLERMASGRLGSGQRQLFAFGGASPQGSRLVEELRERVAEQVRERIGEALRERLASVVQQRLDETLRRHLGGALRAALVEQSVLGRGFDLDQMTEVVQSRIADAIRENLIEGMRERIREAL